jgi:hypothetical protein
VITILHWRSEGGSRPAPDSQAGAESASPIRRHERDQQSTDSTEQSASRAQHRLHERTTERAIHTPFALLRRRDGLLYAVLSLKVTMGERDPLFRNRATRVEDSGTQTHRHTTRASVAARSSATTQLYRRRSPCMQRASPPGERLIRTVPSTDRSFIESDDSTLRQRIITRTSRSLQRNYHAHDRTSASKGGRERAASNGASQCNAPASLAAMQQGSHGSTAESEREDRLDRVAYAYMTAR